VDLLTAGEEYAGYAARVSSLDLMPARATLKNPNYDYDTGAAISTSPAEASRARRGVEVVVTTNPDTDQRVAVRGDPRCEPSEPTHRDPGPDPTAPPELGELDLRFRVYDNTVFKRNNSRRGSPGPGAPGQVLANATLRWGTARWNPNRRRFGEWG
jgi:hypothetical protein